MSPLAYFGIESSGLSLIIDLLILFIVVLYVSLIYWTYADARRRILDPMLVGCATAASLFPFVGTVVYMVLRPPEYLEDVHERELEMQAAEARLHELDYGLCPHCDYRVERDFIRCPSCLRKLKDRCVSCARPLERTWTICPYCEAEVPARPKSSRRSGRRDEAPASTRATIEKQSPEQQRVAKPVPASRSRRADEETVAGVSSPASISGDGRAIPEPATEAGSRARSVERAPEPPAPTRSARPRPSS